eukprot:9499187-Pyramimonas_sp.AAC.1
MAATSPRGYGLPSKTAPKKSPRKPETDPRRPQAFHTWPKTPPQRTKDPRRDTRMATRGPEGP